MMNIIRMSQIKRITGKAAHKPYALAAFSALLMLCGNTSAVSWRSTLYPENWTPSDKDAQNRFLHDFSYAGYHQGTLPIPTTPPGAIYNATNAPYNADNTGSSDATAAIQQAIDAAGAAGGGIVYLPAGTYKVAPGANAYALRISNSGVVLRGAGTNQTFILNTDTYMRLKNMILFQPTTGDWHTPLTGTEILATADIWHPTRTIPLASVSGLSTGEIVVVRADCTADFALEHDMDPTLWNEWRRGPTFIRKITGIDTTANTIKIDIPTRYYLKMRDNARIYKVAPHIEEIGIEDLSIGMIQNPKTGWADGDYTNSATGAYEVHGSHVIRFQHVRNGWMQRVNTYRPAANTNDFHVLSNVLYLDRSAQITVRNCVVQKTQYEGGGGNGYGFTLGSGDSLFTQCEAIDTRHNYDFKNMWATGNVIHQSRGASPRLGSDFHMFLSMANLLDSMTMHNDFIEARYRPFVNHGHTTTESVFWNTYGTGSAGKVVESRQWGWGYIIGTSGTRSQVVRGTTDPHISGTGTASSAPEDFLEGEGTGDTLAPQSLYLDQFERRMKGVQVWVGTDATVAPNPAHAISGSVYTYGDKPVSVLWSQVSGPTATFANAASLTTTVALPEEGVYVLALTAWDEDKTNSATITITADTALPSAWHFIRGEAENTTNQPLGYYTTASNIIGTSGAGGSREDRNMVMGFALPTLPEGHTLDEAAFSFEITQGRDSTGGANLPELHAYLLDTVNPADSGTSFYYHGSLDPSVNSKRVGTTSVTITGTADVNFLAGEQPRSFTLTGDALALLQSYYDGNTPTRSNVYFRFNLSVDPLVTTYRRYRVSTASDGSSLHLVSSTPAPLMQVLHDGTEITIDAISELPVTLPDAAVTQTYVVTNLIAATTNLYLTGTPAVVFSESGTATHNGFSITTNITGAATNRAPGAASPFTIQFVTSTVGSYTGTVSIANSDAQKNPYTFKVTATVAAEAYTVTYNGNSNDGGTAPSAQTKMHDMNLTLAANSGNLARSGYSFAGWNTVADGLGTSYPAGGNYAANASVILYVKWNTHPSVNAGPDQTVTISGQTAWSPAEMATVAWYDAADSNTITLVNGKVSQWNDKSMNNRHAMQGSDANRPTYLAGDPMVNNLPSIGNISTNGSIGLNTPSLTATRIYVVTYYRDGTNATFATYSTLFSGPGTYGLYRVMGNSPATPTADFIATSAFNTGGTFKNGSTTSSLTALPMPASVFKFQSTNTFEQVYSLGFNTKDNARDWQGFYSEWIFTDGTEDLANQQKVEGYLAHKWGLAANLPAGHPHKDAAPGAPFATVTLTGTASDLDGDSLTTAWSVVGGDPAAVTFADASSTNTTVTFTTNGVYTLRLTANDGFGSSYNDVVITVLESNFQKWLVDNGYDAGTSEDTLAANGVSTLREVYIAGLNPTDPESLFVINHLGWQSGDPAMQWAGVTGRLYRVYWSSNLLNGFELIQTNIPWNSTTFTDAVHRASAKGFYRIGVKLE